MDRAERVQRLEVHALHSRTEPTFKLSGPKPTRPPDDGTPANPVYLSTYSTCNYLQRPGAP